MVPLARRNLLAEKARFAMSTLGVAFAVLLVLIVVSLYRGWGDVGRFYTQLPGAVWIAQPGTSDPFHSTSFVPVGAARIAAGVKGVRAAVPVYARHIAFGRHGKLDVFALALGAPRSAHGATRFVPVRGHIDIDRMLAGSAGVHVGDTLDVIGRRLVVSRIHNGGNSVFQTAFLNAADARALFGFPGYVNFLLLELAPTADPSAVGAAVTRAIPGVEAHTATEFATSFSSRVTSGFLSVVGVLVAIGLIVGGAVIALTIYTATVERSREYGVLEAIGAERGYLYRVVLEQSLIVGTLGAALGIAATAVVAPTIRDRVPEFIVELRVSDLASVFAAALAMSVAASYFPLRRIERIDPAEVFRA